jgi:hypothetical protein
VPLAGRGGSNPPSDTNYQLKRGNPGCVRMPWDHCLSAGDFVFKRAAGASRYFILGTVTTGDLRRQLVARTSERRELLEDVET